MYNSEDIESCGCDGILFIYSQSKSMFLLTWQMSLSSWSLLILEYLFSSCQLCRCTATDVIFAGEYLLAER